MSELQVIQTAVELAARRRRWQRAWRGLWHGLFAGGLIWLVALAFYKSFPLPIYVLPLAGLAGGLCLAAGFITGWWRSPTLADTARWLDNKEHLKERLSSALEFGASPKSGHWQQLVVADAATHARKLDLARLLPFHLPKVTRWAVLVLALGVGLGFVPEYRSQEFVQKEADKQNIKLVGQQLKDLTKRQIAQRPPALETTQKAMDTVSDIGEQLQKKPLTRSEALKELANVADKMKEQVKEMGKDPALRRLEKAGRTPGGETTTSPSALQKKMAELSKTLGDKAATPDKLDQLKKDLQKIKDAAAGLPDSNSPNADSARDQLAQSLSSLAQQARDLGADLPGLEKAMAALAQAKPDLALKDLQQALKDLDKMRDMAKSLQQLQQQAAKLGKDLAEQLKNGQAEAAQATLQKMAEQLEAAALTPEQLKKLMEEVSQAVDPAGEYGKVAELLKQAGQQMEKGQQPGAAKSLADAAKELAKLMEKMSDAESLMASLEALQKAELAIGSGKCFGGGGSASGSGSSGKAGKGVGTWADEQTGWQTAPEISDLWDNSGVERADEKGRGHSDRGDGKLADNLTPTKVKGQFTPGGQMPSITLKGVSIKGQSNVKYEEAVTAAQTEAQSALSQEKVPRAYKGAVRDYFDDLKK